MGDLQEGAFRLGQDGSPDRVGADQHLGGYRLGPLDLDQPEDLWTAEAGLPDGSRARGQWKPPRDAGS
jgi:hypothetical protein